MDSPFPFPSLGPWDFVIVGAGSAGLTAAETLREVRPDHTILILDKDDRPPYKKTQTSKNLINEYGTQDWELKEPEWYKEKKIHLGWNCKVKSINPERGRLYMESGEEILFEKLLLALGAQAKEHRDYPGALTLRSARDGQNIQEAVVHAKKVQVIGAGVLGVEVCDQMIRLGKEVHLVCKNPFPLFGNLTPRAGEILKNIILSNGVSISPDPLEEKGLINVLTIGSSPVVEIAKKTGLKTDYGILVNASFRTSHPRIWAAGDCAQLPSGQVGHLWHQAQSQGKDAAHDMSELSMIRDTRVFRMKLEAFGDYFFTAGDINDNPDLENERDGIYQAFWFDEKDQVKAIVMIGDKDRNKAYQEALWDGLRKEKLLETLGI